MPDSHSPLDRLVQGARRLAAGLRPGHVAVVAALAVVGGGIGLVRTVVLPGPQPVLDGERMKIQVVAPVEPSVAPGSVMEVGDLVEGFEYRRPAPALIEAVDEAPYDLEFETPARRLAPRREDNDDYGTAPAPPPPDTPPEDRRERRADRWFGFDAPDRDYRAEREARRARMDAQDRERREVRWYRSDGQPAGDEGSDEDRDLRRR